MAPKAVIKAPRIFMNTFPIKDGKTKRIRATTRRNSDFSPISPAIPSHSLILLFSTNPAKAESRNPDATTYTIIFIMPELPFKRATREATKATRPRTAERRALISIVVLTLRLESRLISTPFTMTFSATLSKRRVLMRVLIPLTRSTAEKSVAATFTMAEGQIITMRPKMTRRVPEIK